MKPERYVAMPVTAVPLAPVEVFGAHIRDLPLRKWNWRVRAFNAGNLR